MNDLTKKYANLLTNYSLSVQKGEKVLVRSSIASEPLLKHLHDEILAAGGHPHFQLEIPGTNASFYDYADSHQLQYVDELTLHAMNHFDCYLVVRAPHNLRETANVSREKRAVRREAQKPLNEVYFSRTASGELKRSLCQYPTHASAQEAGMSLEEYQRFVFKACGLFEEDAEQYWLQIRESQQQLVDFLNDKETIRFYNSNSNTDISFSTKNRTWINSDGRNNMPSGEVFTAPVEDSVNGKITFSYPSIYEGKEVTDVELVVENGVITQWSATKGEEVLDEVFATKGARRFGEAAIGTNYHIQQVTKNILFDEKIGGSIHMAVGQAYKQCGGKNESTIHWDMITDMQNGGRIYADNELFYEYGKVKY